MTYICIVETSRPRTSAHGPRAEPAAASLHARALRLLAAQQARLQQLEVLVDQEIRRLEEEVADRDRGDGYQLRYEVAMNDLHDLEAKNAELQRQLDQANAAAGSLPGQDRGPGGRIDWEAEKRRTLAALEAEVDDHDAPQYGQRLKIENVLHTSEQVIAEKDRQIRELQEQLEEHSRRPGATAVDTTASDQAVESDAAIQKERERLQRLEDEWREKLRQAEIEISLERARLARQRADIEERLTAPENGSPKPATGAGRPDQPTSRRWLARLGLTEADKESGKR